PPAPRAMHSTAAKPSTGWMLPGAASSPHRPVNTTRLITRGLVSAKKSRHSAGSGAVRVSVWTVAVMSLSKGGAPYPARPLPLSCAVLADHRSMRGCRALRADRVVVRVVVLDHRQRLELMVRRRARQRPLERRRPFAPVVRRSLLPRKERVEHVREEEEH